MKLYVGEMIKFGLLLAVCVVSCSGLKDTRNVTLTGDEWDWVIQNFSGFNYWRRNETWTINTDGNSTIKVYCLQMLLPHRTENVCYNGKLVFDDGVSQNIYCGRSEKVLYQGKSSKLKVDYVVQPGYSSVFYCKGKSVHPPSIYETINVTPSSKILLEYPDVLGKDRDQAFLFNSTSGSPITLKCTKKMERPVKKSGLCVTDILTIDSGNGPKVSCGKGKVTAIGNQIKMRVETYQATRGHVRCVAQG